MIQSYDLPQLDSLLKKFWDLKSLGISADEPSVYDKFKSTVQLHGNRYVVTLPWRPNPTQLPSNLNLATRRLQGLLRRLHQQPDVQREYHAIMQGVTAAGNN